MCNILKPLSELFQLCNLCENFESLLYPGTLGYKNIRNKDFNVKKKLMTTQRNTKMECVTAWWGKANY